MHDQQHDQQQQKFEEEARASVTVSGDPRGTIVVRGTLSHLPDDSRLHYVAPAPIDRRSSFSGSGLPYASATQAFWGSLNRGVVEVGAIGNTFEIELVAPSAYYEQLGTVLVQPILYLAYVAGGVEMTSSIGLSRPVPFRTLSYQPQRKGPGFYDVKPPPVRSQEAVLRSSAFPSQNVQPADFWGGKPPC